MTFLDPEPAIRWAEADRLAALLAQKYDAHLEKTWAKARERLRTGDATATAADRSRETRRTHRRW